MTASTGTDSTPSIRQHTLRQSAYWRGVRRQRRADVLVVHPADPDTGVRFVRHGEDLATGAIPARWDSVVDTHGGIVLGNTRGTALRGAIPLLAALRVAGIDNAVVEVHGSRIAAEVSDFEFYLGMLADLGTQTQTAARHLHCVVERLEVRDRFGFVRLSPDTGFHASVNITTILPGGGVGSACATLKSDLTEPDAGFSVKRCWSNEETPAPTGDNGVSRLLREFHALPEALRAMVVELIGHLALTGAPVAANVDVHGSGPRIYPALLHAVMERRAVSLTTVNAHRAQLNSVSAADVK
jgi:UDP-3-O-[3-hydroxymyristoyl] N-acetylglucosamine deacetylase